MMRENQFNYNFSLSQKTALQDIQDTFSARTMNIFSRAVNQAYKWVNLWLQDPSNAVLVSYEWKKYTRGFAVGIAVDYFLIKEILDEDLEFTFTFKYTSNRSYPYLVISDKNKTFELTVNQTQRTDKCATRANFRDQLIDKYQSSLFTLESEFPLADKKYFQLTHGYQTEIPGFINLGIPSKDRAWINYIDISQLPQVIESPILKTKAAEYQPMDLAALQNYISEVVNNE